MIYGFSLNYIGTKALYKLKLLDCCYIVYSNNIDHYLNMLLHDQPEFILGLGGYSGGQQNDIKVEAFSKPLNEANYSPKFGNALCSLISWKITQLINQKTLRSKYAYLHIPSTTPLNKIVLTIEEILKESQKI